VTRPAKILIDSLELHGFHGWHKHEGEFGQHFMVDLEMLVDIERAALTDQLGDALDYGAVIGATSRLFRERRYRLLEAVAVAVGRGLLAEFAMVQSIKIRVKKLAPPVPERLAFAGVEVVVSRGEADA
jgi:7,8-dihydroneopterin aldolase/epimerase/oxygenase